MISINTIYNCSSLKIKHILTDVKRYLLFEDALQSINVNTLADHNDVFVLDSIFDENIVALRHKA